MTTALLLDLVIAGGMLVVMPLGLRLIDRVPAAVHRIWPVTAAAGALSLLLPRGVPAALLAAGYGATTVALAALALLRLHRHRSLAPRELAVLTALATPSIAGSCLVAERYGYQLLGFDLQTLSLTVAHFHYAGFAAALVAALVCAATADSPIASTAAAAVPAGIAVVFAGFFTSTVVELLGAVILTAGMWLAAYLTWSDIRRRAAGAATRLLFTISALVPAGTMLLALSWAVGRAMDLPHPSLAFMVATHGLANAVGFVLCAILAWRRLHTTTAREPQWIH